MLEDVLSSYFAYLDATHRASRAETTSCNSSASSTMRGGMPDAHHVGDLPVENKKVRVGRQHHKNEQQIGAAETDHAGV